MFGDGQAEAGSTCFTRPRRIHAVKPLKDPGLVSAWNTDAGVGNGQNHFVFRGMRAEGDFSVRQGVLNGVVQEVLQNFRETSAVAADVRQILRDLDGNAEFFVGGAVLGGLEAAVDQLRHAEAAIFESMSKSSVRRARRRECSRIISRKRVRFCGSSMAPARSVSVKP